MRKRGNPSLRQGGETAHNVEISAQRLEQNGYFLGRLFETGVNRHGLPVAPRSRDVHEHYMGRTIRELWEEGYGLKLTLPEKDENRTFVRYYSGDFDQNPQLITAEEEAMDIVDLCIHIYHGGSLAIVANPGAITYRGIVQQLAKKG